MNHLNIEILILILKYLDYKSLFNIMLSSKYFLKLIKKHYKTIYLDILNNFDINYISDLTFKHATSLKICYENLEIYDIVINKFEDKIIVNKFYNILNEALVIAHYKHFASVLIINDKDNVTKHKLYKYLLKGDLVVYLDKSQKIKNIEIYVQFNNHLLFNKLEIGHNTLFCWEFTPFYWCRIRDKNIPIFLEYNNLDNIEEYFVGHATDIYILRIDNWIIVSSNIELIQKTKINKKILKLFYKIEYEMDGYCGLVKNILFANINDFDEMCWALDYYTYENKELKSIIKISDFDTSL